MNTEQEKPVGFGELVFTRLGEEVLELESGAGAQYQYILNATELYTEIRTSSCYEYSTIKISTETKQSGQNFTCA